MRFKLGTHTLITHVLALKNASTDVKPLLRNCRFDCHETVVKKHFKSVMPNFYKPVC